MFFIHQDLRRRGGRFYIVWLAATNKRKLRKPDMITANVVGACKSLLEHVPRAQQPQSVGDASVYSIYLLGQLMYGIVVLHRQQTAYLLEDVNELVGKSAKLKGAQSKINLRPNQIIGKDINLPDPLQALHGLAGILPFGAPMPNFDEATPISSLDELDFFSIGSSSNGAKKDGRKSDRRQATGGDRFSARLSDITLNEERREIDRTLVGGEQVFAEEVLPPAPEEWTTQLPLDEQKEWRESQIGLSKEHEKEQPMEEDIVPPPTEPAVELPPQEEVEVAAPEPEKEQPTAAEEPTVERLRPPAVFALDEMDEDDVRQARDRRRGRASRRGHLIVDEWASFSKLQLMEQMQPNEYQDTLHATDEELAHFYTVGATLEKERGEQTVDALFKSSALDLHQMMNDRVRRVGEWYHHVATTVKPMAVVDARALWMQPGLREYVDEDSLLLQQQPPPEEEREERRPQMLIEGGDEQQLAQDQMQQQPIEEEQPPIAVDGTGGGEPIDESVEAARRQSSIDSAVGRRGTRGSVLPLGGQLDMIGEFDSLTAVPRDELTAEKVDEVTDVPTAAEVVTPARVIDTRPLPVFQYVLRKEQVYHEIETACAEASSTTFADVCPVATTDRCKAGKTFSMLLDLLKEKAVTVRQSKAFGPIHISLAE